MLELKETDRWCTPQNIFDLTDNYWLEGIGLHPFWDPSALVKCATHFDIRKGQDAYVLPWRPFRIWAQPPYSGSNPARTAEKTARVRASEREIMMMVPANAGATYWKRYVWPHASCIAWLGRVQFIAGCDMHDKKGQLTHKKGDVGKQNRTEIALVGYLDRPRAFKETFSTLGGYPVTVI